MGGRGQSGGGGGGNGIENFSNGLNPYGDLSSISLEEAIGEQGEPMSMVDAYFDANPYYSDQYSDYSWNCQRCVMAYEMRRRGYDVIALPTYKGDQMPSNGNWMSAMDGLTEKSVGGTTVKKQISNIQTIMEEWGDGSRAVLRLKWLGGGGHVVNVENSGGKLHFYDAQDKTRLTGMDGLKKEINNCSLSRTSLVRTDTATVNSTMRYMVSTKRITDLT